MQTKIFIFILAGLISYAFVFHAPFKTIDDHAAIVNNPLIKDLSNLNAVFTSSYFGLNIYWRPLVFLSHMVEFHLFGLNPFFYYLTNVFINVATAVVVYALMRVLTKDDTSAFFTALLFIIHPIHGTAVANISGRPMVLCSFFYLLSLYGYCLFKNSKRILIFILSIVSFMLALLSKESAIMLPGLLIFYEWVFTKGNIQKKLRSMGWTVPYWFILAVYFILRKSLGIVRLFEERGLREGVLQVITFFRGVLTYVQLFIYPQGYHFDRAARIMPSIFHLSVFVMFGIFAGLIVILIIKRKRISPIIFFFIGWFFIELIPVSQIFAGIRIQPEYIALSEHFVYTAAVGIFALISIGCKKIYLFNGQQKWISKNTFKAVICGYLMFFLIVTIQQSIIASSERAMLAQTLAHNPENVRMRESYAWAFVKLHRYAEAEEQYRKVLARSPEHTRARISLGKVLCDQGRYIEGLKEYERVVNPGQYVHLLQQNINATLNILIDEFQGYHVWDSQ